MAEAEEETVKHLKSAATVETILNYSGSDILAWSACRQKCFKVVTNSKTDVFVSAMILSNIVIMIYETDLRAAGFESPVWATATNSSLLVFYILELSVRLYVFRSHFFISSANVLDFVIVGVDVIFEMLGSVIGDMPNVTMLRLFRVLRALRFVRAVRSLVFFRELYMIMNGFFSAMKAIVWATVLLFVVLMIWSVVFVELIQPLVPAMVEEGAFGDDCERCGRAFSSTMSAMLTFTQQIVAGDEWGAVSVPIIERHPWTAIFFSAVLVTVDLGLMNLILSVIVDKAQQAHNDDVKFQAQEKEEEFRKLKKQLLRFCSQLDEDNSGSLTLDELLGGFDENPEFHLALTSMDVQREDISSLFNILDDDSSGHVEYDEFVDQLHKMKTQDSHVVLVFIRGSVKEIKSMMLNQGKQITQIQERLDTNEARWDELNVTLTERPLTGRAGISARRSPQDMQNSSNPQVYSNFQGPSGGCFTSCAGTPQEKSQDYMAPLLAPQNVKMDEEIKGLKENIALLNSSLMRMMGDGTQLGNAELVQSSLGGASQALLVQPPALAQQGNLAPPSACCVSSGQYQRQEELGIRPLPPGDVVNVQADGKGFYQGGRGKGKGIGKKGGRV